MVDVCDYTFKELEWKRFDPPSVNELPKHERERFFGRSKRRKFKQNKLMSLLGGVEKQFCLPAFGKKDATLCLEDLAKEVAEEDRIPFYSTSVVNVRTTDPETGDKYTERCGLEEEENMQGLAMKLSAVEKKIDREEMKYNQDPVLLKLLNIEKTDLKMQWDELENFAKPKCYCGEIKLHQTLRMADRQDG